MDRATLKDIFPLSGTLATHPGLDPGLAVKGAFPGHKVLGDLRIGVVARSESFASFTYHVHDGNVHDIYVVEVCKVKLHARKFCVGAVDLYGWGLISLPQGMEAGWCNNQYCWDSLICLGWTHLQRSHLQRLSMKGICNHG